MRVGPFSVGDYLHIYNRGTRKTRIVRDEKDKWRFMQSLRFFNDSHSSLNLLRQLQDSLREDDVSRAESVFEVGWPADWPEKDSLIKILCYCLMPNHFHLLVKEIREDGLSKFMQKLGGFTQYFNSKYQEEGNLFQGSYKGKCIEEQRYLKYLSVYIQVVNVMELYPGGIEEAFKNIDKALKFVGEYPFSSYQDYVGIRDSLIIDKDVLGEIFPTPEEYKEFTREMIESQKYRKLDDLKID